MLCMHYRSGAFTRCYDILLTGGTRCSTCITANAFAQCHQMSIGNSRLRKGLLRYARVCESSKELLWITILPKQSIYVQVPTLHLLHKDKPWVRLVVSAPCLCLLFSIPNTTGWRTVPDFCKSDMTGYTRPVVACMLRGTSDFVDIYEHRTQGEGKSLEDT